MVDEEVEKVENEVVLVIIFVIRAVSNLLSRMSLRKSSIPSAPTYPLAPHDDESETTFSNAAQPTQKYLERMEEKGQENIRVGKGAGAGVGVGVGVGDIKREREREAEAEIKKERETITAKKRERDREREELRKREGEKEDDDIIDGETIEAWTDDELLIRAEYEATDEEKNEGKREEKEEEFHIGMAKPKTIVTQQSETQLECNDSPDHLR